MHVGSTRVAIYTMTLRPLYTLDAHTGIRDAPGASILASLIDPKDPCNQIVYTLAPSTYIGTTLRPKHILFGYMNPKALDPKPPYRNLTVTLVTEPCGIHGTSARGRSLQRGF